MQWKMLLREKLKQAFLFSYKQSVREELKKLLIWESKRILLHSLICAFIFLATFQVFLVLIELAGQLMIKGAINELDVLFQLGVLLIVTSVLGIKVIRYFRWLARQWREIRNARPGLVEVFHPLAEQLREEQMKFFMKHASKN